MFSKEGLEKLFTKVNFRFSGAKRRVGRTEGPVLGIGRLLQR